MGIDYAYLLNQKSHLQQAADAAAIAGANEMYIAQADASRIKSVAKSVAEATLDSGTPFDIQSKSDRKDGVVKVAMAQSVDLAFAEILGLSTSTVAVEAEAKVVGSGRICVIGLEEKSSKAISLEHDAKMDAPTCSVFSNSTSSSGIHSKDGARLHAEFICSAGGKDGGKANFNPEPLTDCPKIPDPLAARPAPRIGACSFKGLKLDGGAHTLGPGTYCGGIEITNGASVTMKPGTYVMKDGPLKVDDDGQLRGEFVGFYFTGKGAKLRFDKDSTIDLSAPKSGDMAGVLFFQDRKAKEGAKFHITSNNARNLLGTIYLPKGRLYIDADADIAKESAYTAVVAQKIELSEGPILHLNTNYSATDIPVPVGIGPVGGNVMLTR